MSVYCAKSGELIAGVKPVKMIAKKRNVIYKDINSDKQSTGWEIVQEIWVHPDIAHLWADAEPEVVGEVIREVDMTKVRSRLRDREYEDYDE